MALSYKKRLEKVNALAQSYEEWKSLAEESDYLNKMLDWREKDQSTLYDYEEVSQRYHHLKELLKAKDGQGLLFALHEGIHGNMAGMGNPKLYHKALSGTKTLIEAYVDTIVEALDYIFNCDESEISADEKIAFFDRASACFGRSALMLSGGGQLGNFHFGVLKAIIHADLLPRVISGSSAGSIYAALVGTHTIEELKDFTLPANLAKEVERRNGIFSVFFKRREKLREKQLQEILERNIPDMTFEEAYAKTGRYINISVAPAKSHQRSRLLNAIASPNVLIRSAVLASCAIPGIFSPVRLVAKDKNGDIIPYLPRRKWVDGSVSNDLPAKRLMRLYGVNHFIVSMTNPILLPFFTRHSENKEWWGAIRRYSTMMIKETTRLNYTLTKPFFKHWPKLAVLANGVQSIVQQNYRGDVNIVADFSVVKPANLLSLLTRQEINQLIEKGERTTWPRLEQIRVCTRVGKKIDEILDYYHDEEMKWARDWDQPSIYDEDE